MGVWIETENDLNDFLQKTVTPCVGVWIETLTPTLLYFANYVTPCVGVWIETHLILMRWSLHSSHPAWVCGLKP